MTQPILFSDDIRSHGLWGGLTEASLGLALAEYCLQSPGMTLIIAPDNWAAKQLANELDFFLKESSLAENIILFPDWETLPYDQFSPHQDLISERLKVLSQLSTLKQGIVISSAATLMHRLCPPTYVQQFSLCLAIHQPLCLDDFRQNLIQAGYRSVNAVMEHGEFAVRGSIIDVFPMGNPLPFRIELFDQSIESLRRFDPDNQRSIDKIDRIDILPAREVSLSEASIAHFRQDFRTHFSGNPSLCPIYEQVTAGLYPAGIEYFLPLFFEQTASFFEYLPKNTNICLVESIAESAEQFWQEANLRYEQARHDVSRPILAPQKLFLSPIDLLTLSKSHPRQLFTRQASARKQAYNFKFPSAPDLSIVRQSPEPLKALADYIKSDQRRYALIVESKGRRELLSDLLKPSQLFPKIQDSWSAFLADQAPLSIVLGPLSAGLELDDLSLIAEAQIFGQQSTPQRLGSAKSVDPDLIIRNLAELNIGDPVVHLQFGVGRYQGLQSFNHNDIPNEFLILSYAGEDKIYVPITSLHMISRYTGSDPAHAPLHRLGTDAWQNQKKKAAEKISDVAIQLLEVFAKREQTKGFACELHPADYQRFATQFPFELTLDQAKAIDEITKDMSSSRPMDRLICGDVGFGKTEVAMRAAFIAARDGKQVCVLVPTTLLAEQHLTSFKDRFADFPIQIELLSRFRTAKESQQVIQGLASGQIDVVIGTHKLFQKSVVFKQLGLLIIDEEHRFGVKQKEHLKTLRTHVDVLSMTATPIPRTLNMAMSGIRDISLIATPPAKRLAIKTFWQERTDATLIEAILREILRGGQVFFLHNNVQSIQTVTQSLQQLVPQARVHFAHGQMHERELERIMSDFYHHRFNVLVCTTIIETGIDIPTANTIIIDHADRFGLAQLHQLRGRVGRSHHQAYAYLLTPPVKLLSSEAVKRLEAIVSLEDLGAGFSLATQDLEIRGAGELLGEEQSGNMHAIGFSLFMEMLEKAVSDLKSGKIPELNAPIHQGPEIELQCSSIIPESYIADVHVRLIVYKRIAHAKSDDALHQLQVELIDRFGLLPPSVKHLFAITRLKFLASEMGILKIQAAGIKGRIEFDENPKINPAVLIKLIQQQSLRYQLQGPSRLNFNLEATQDEAKIDEIARLIMLLRG